MMPGLSDKLIPPLIRNPCNGYVNPYGIWVDEFIPYIYHMEIVGVDPPDRTYNQPSDMKRLTPLSGRISMSETSTWQPLGPLYKS